MYAMQIVREAAKASGKTLSQIGVEMGKSRQYVNAIETRGSTPNANTLAQMLDVCGWSLCALPNEQVPEAALVVDAKSG